MVTIHSYRIGGADLLIYGGIRFYESHEWKVAYGKGLQSSLRGLGPG